MVDYTKIPCPVCKKPFRESDDIVVCPECGAPYHRECYEKAEKCIFDELHASGTEWAPPPPPRTADPTAEIKDVECPVCGTLNTKSAAVCTRCGTILKDPGNAPTGHTHSTAEAPHVYPPQDRQSPPQGGVYPPIFFDPMGGVNPTEIVEPGVTYGDVSRVVKTNTPYYMAAFRYIKQSGRNKFNFSAFLFSGVWMLYRKQNKWGAIITGLMAALYILFQAACSWVYLPTLLGLAEQAGIDLGSTAMTNEQIWQVSALATQDTFTYLKLMSPLIVLGVMFIIMIISGVRGNKMYLKHCVSTVRTVKQNQDDGDPDMTLDAQGGVNSIVAVCFGIAYFLLSTLLPMLML